MLKIGCGLRARAAARPAQPAVVAYRTASSRDTRARAVLPNASQIGCLCGSAGMQRQPQAPCNARSSRCSTRLSAVSDPWTGQSRQQQDSQSAQSDGSITVCTTDGELYHTTIRANMTVGEVRALVALLLGTEAGMVRLAYRGRELQLFEDSQTFVKKEGVNLLHAMSRPAADPAPQQEQLKVYSMEGNVHRLTVTPGATTAADIRRAVAQATATSVTEVRLQYAGKELNPTDDNRALEFKPSVFVMHTMRRMQGGISPFTRSSSMATPFLKDALQHRHQLSPVNSSAGQRSESALEAQQVFMAADNLKALTAVVAAPPEVAPGASRGSAVAQLAKQFRDLLKHPIPGVSAAPDDNDPMKWHVRLAGPQGTPYADGWFDVELQFSNDFPGRVPLAYFRTKIWHPNVHKDTGEVCIDIGGQVCSVGCVLSALQQLLTHPNPASALNNKCAREMQVSPDVYIKMASLMTLEHAMGLETKKTRPPEQSANRSYVAHQADTLNNHSSSVRLQMLSNPPLYFKCCVAAGAACLALALFIGLPSLSLSPGKFKLFFVAGCCLVFLSFVALEVAVQNEAHARTRVATT